jgi:glycerol-3-phosphate dehydrogenase (NAD(P)+)
MPAMTTIPVRPFDRVAVIGAGAWGTAIALAACRAGRAVVLWMRDPERADALRRDRENSRYLPGVRLDDGIEVTADLARVADAQSLMLVTPAQHLRAVGAALAPHIRPGTPAVIAAKGIERGTGCRMSEVVEAVMPEAPVAVLSGPTFAAEVARGLPSAVTLACADAAIGARLVETLGSRCFRPYLSDDVTGAQIGGAVKNVLAIASGIVQGRRLGDNARAALITRGLAEIARLAQALGARPETLMGLSGLGDLTLTCTSLQSRNLSLGAALGEGRTLAEVLGERHSVAEGVHTAAAVVELAGRHGVDLPICRAVDAILNRGADIDATITALLTRPFRTESS